ncbi:MAG: alpha/beta hydrolase-fold protein [Chloroflexota bacterium]
MKRRVGLMTVVMFLLFLSVVPLSAQEVSAQFPAVIVPNTQIIPFTSKITSHDYWLSVALPDSYGSSEQTYPVLYLLDPSFSFLTATEFARFMAFTSVFPELIIVGIGYPADKNVFEARSLDYGLQDDFLDFISTELIPLIDSSYRTNPADRALVGYQVGGDFLFHTLVNKPELFNRYIAIYSAAADLMPYLMRNDKTFRSWFVGRDVRLFIAEQGTAILSAAIQKRAYEGLTVSGLSLASDMREPTLHLSLPAGLLAIYCGESACARETGLLD